MGTIPIPYTKNQTEVGDLGVRRWSLRLGLEVSGFGVKAWGVSDFGFWTWASLLDHFRRRYNWYNYQAFSQPTSMPTHMFDLP